MKVVIAMDSFKGSMTTYEAGNAVAEGIKRVFPDAETVVSPLADGGEGSADVLIFANHGIRKSVRVQNPLGTYITAEYGILPEKKTAVLEMAAAAGITLIADEDKNPMHTTTYGVGEMIADAIKEGCRTFVVGIGGSATNDGGIGMLAALGYGFLDKSGHPVPDGAEGLCKLETIRTEHVLPELAECTFLIACDVQNPLCGSAGCSAVYGPQKGADAQMITVMDEAMVRFEQLTRQAICPCADGNVPGSGAAGGLGFAFRTYLNGTLQSGISLIISQTGLEEEIKTADYVITGEGRLDGQSRMGKTPVGVASVAKRYGKPVFAFAGGVTEDARACNHCGIDAFFSVVKGPCSLEEAMKPENAVKNLTDAVEQVFRVVQSGRITKTG